MLNANDYVGIIELTDVETNNLGGYESEQYDLLQGESNYDIYLGISDNGGYPDGSDWLIWDVDPNDPNAQAAIAAGAIFHKGVETQYDQAFKETTVQFIGNVKWSAVESASKAVFCAELTDDGKWDFAEAELAARICQTTYNEVREDDEIDTLAARVMG